MSHIGPTALDTLPPGVTLLMMGSLAVADVVRMSEVCWALRRLACDERVWRTRVAALAADRVLEELQAGERAQAQASPSGLQVKTGGGYWMGVYAQTCASKGCVWIPDELRRRLARLDSSTIPNDEIMMVVLGNTGSGKSATLVRLVRRGFVDDYDPTCEASFRHMHSVEGVRIRLELVDTSGSQEDIARMDNFLYHVSNYIFMYSVTNRDSFEALQSWIDTVMLFKGTTSAPTSVLVGNKVDLLPDSAQVTDPDCRVKRQVSVAEGREFARSHGIPFIESSARTGVNVLTIFDTLARFSLAPPAQARDAADPDAQPHFLAGPLSKLKLTPPSLDACILQ